jgi:hypothetical protein
MKLAIIWSKAPISQQTSRMGDSGNPTVLPVTMLK